MNPLTELTRDRACSEWEPGDSLSSEYRRLALKAQMDPEHGGATLFALLSISAAIEETS